MTEHKRAESALRQLAQVVEYSSVVIIITDIAGSIQYVNPKFVEISGYSSEEVIGKNPRMLQSGHTAPADYARLWKTLSTGGVWNGEFHNKKKNGDLYWESATISPIVNILGETTQFLAIKYNITDHKHAEEAVRLSEVRLALALEINHTGVWDLNLIDHTAVRTLSHDQIFGYDALLPRWTFEMLLEHVLPEDRPDVNRMFISAVEERTELIFNCRIRRIDGEVRWIYVKGMHEKDTIGKSARMSGLVHDITERKRAEELLQKTMIDLKHSEEQTLSQQMQLLQAGKMASLGILVSGIAHEINNPNNLVMFNGDLISRIMRETLPILDEFYEAHPDQLLSGLPYHRTRKGLEGLLNGLVMGSERIRDIVANLKDFARIDAGAMNQQIRINDIVQSALLIVGNLVRKSTDAIVVEYGDAMPDAVGNIQQIEQVIINLVTNACHALTDQTQAIRIRTHYNSTDNKVYVDVSDEGIGISTENVARLFDPFFTTKRDIGGTGLGLSISYNIVLAHKGELLVHSIEGEGTTFSLCLPGCRVEEKQ